MAEVAELEQDEVDDKVRWPIELKHVLYILATRTNKFWAYLVGVRDLRRKNFAIFVNPETPTSTFSVNYDLRLFQSKDPFEKNAPSFLDAVEIALRNFIHELEQLSLTIGFKYTYNKSRDIATIEFTTMSDDDDIEDIAFIPLPRSGMARRHEVNALMYQLRSLGNKNCQLLITGYFKNYDEIWKQLSELFALYLLQGVERGDDAAFESDLMVKVNISIQTPFSRSSKKDFDSVFVTNTELKERPLLRIARPDLVGKAAQYLNENALQLKELQYLPDVKAYFDEHPVPYLESGIPEWVDEIPKKVRDWRHFEGARRPPTTAMRPTPGGRTAESRRLATFRKY